MIKLEKILKLNKLVHIGLLDEAGFPVRYPSRVEDVDGRGIILATPFKDRVPVFIPKGTLVNVWVVETSAVYTFHSDVIERITGTVNQIYLKRPKRIDIVQNREYVRVQMFIDILLSYKLENNELQEFWCKSNNLSAGGLMLNSTKPILLSEGGEVNLNFQVNNQIIQSKATIIWKGLEQDNDGAARNIIGVKFQNLSDAIRKHIIKHVYELQIELRRKGLQ